MWTQTDARSNESTEREREGEESTPRNYVKSSQHSNCLVRHMRVGWRLDAAQRPTRITPSLFPYRKIYLEMHFQSLTAHRELRPAAPSNGRPQMKQCETKIKLPGSQNRKHCGKIAILKWTAKRLLQFCGHLMMMTWFTTHNQCRRWAFRSFAYFN